MATKYNKRGGAEDDAPKEPKAPRMSRSRGQLASAYAPGALFTFEGGLGACLSIPDQGEYPDLAQVSEETKKQIHLRLREIWQNWFTAAMKGGTDKHPALAAQCLDGMLLRGETYHPPAANEFELVNPKNMGYIPAPLAFTCNTCGRFRDYDSVYHASNGLQDLSAGSCDAKNEGLRGKCRWRQLDVVFVHWSGNWEAPTPGRYEWSSERQDVLPPLPGCSDCGSRKFYLRDRSPRIGQWFFECENGHKAGDTWLQNDPDTTQILADECKTRPPRWRRMEPVSYRATSAFYPHAEQFVVFSEEQRDLLEYLQDGKQNELGGFIAERYGLGARPPTDEEILEILERAGHADKVATYRMQQTMVKHFADMGNEKMAEQARGLLADLVKTWKQIPGLIPVQHEVPPLLAAQIQRRADFGSRFDPVVLAVEHESLNRSKLSATTLLDGRAPFVRFNRLDKDLAPKSEQELATQQQVTERLRDALGIADFGLIREFDLCRFTHGYTRMSTDPLIEKTDQQMLRLPVRLRLFPPLGNKRRPIYVVTQANEAIYVRLRAESVFEWLRQVGVADLPEWNPESGVSLGAHVLQQAAPFGKFFSDLHPSQPLMYRYVYTLLHTYAHTVMKAVAEFSGLDLGSLGEYVFPADLAFVVYRNGTTMDLGNLSALWRNYNNTFLEHLLSPRTLLCGSGSLCESKGGACPDCIVIPETSCIASNRLLSRSVLRSGLAPREDDVHKGQVIPGYLDVVQQALDAG
ncbi:hypothetical protein AACH10_02845 [Ideonella sp. DXS22W]|uniref:DUF1998 domain-containing protein n=1 Tax=Pseudaquabacterium inlustre TaxID=2984192 RepID=A0ABU9CBB9_9BURK